MRYTEFRDLIYNELLRHPAGLTWAELKQHLDLPYETPCPTWVGRLESEIGLSRMQRRGRAKIWQAETVLDKQDHLTPLTCLREVLESDLPILFEQQRDPDANYMAAFTVKDPDDREAYLARWRRILADASVIMQIILYDGQVAGSVLSYEDSDRREVSYWLGKEFWGKGIATQALAAYLVLVKARPIYARAARDNIASLRVLEKCGFTICGEDRGFANARGVEVEEFVLVLSP